MNLLEERQSWRRKFEADVGEYPYLLTLYKEKRSSELWRSTRIMEYLCEYALYLESKVNDIDYKSFIKGYNLRHRNGSFSYNKSTKELSVEE